MRRGETDRPRVSPFVAALVGVPIVIVAAVAAVALRPWSVERTLFDPPDSLVLRRRGNALRSYCEIESTYHGHVATEPAECGLDAASPLYGAPELAMTRYGDRSCALDLASARELGCAPHFGEWMSVLPDRVDIGWVDASWGTWIDQIDRTTGEVTTFALPPGSWRAQPMEPTTIANEPMFVTGDQRVLRLVRGGTEEVTPARPHGRAIAAGHGAVFVIAHGEAPRLGIALDGFPTEVDAPFLSTDGALTDARVCGDTIVIASTDATRTERHFHGVTRAGTTWAAVTSGTGMDERCTATDFEFAEPGTPSHVVIDLATGLERARMR